MQKVLSLEPMVQTGQAVPRKAMAALQKAMGALQKAMVAHQMVAVAAPRRQKGSAALEVPRSDFSFEVSTAAPEEPRGRNFVEQGRSVTEASGS